MVSLCPEGGGASVSRLCTDGIGVLVIQQAKPLPLELQAYCFQLGKFHVGKGRCYALGCPGMLPEVVLAPQPLSVCFPSKHAF